jgi:uncharacterized metal-binding protein YceD (DUF177 family)
MSNTHTSELSWSFPVIVSDLPEAGDEFEVAPDEAEREALAQFVGVIAVPSLRAKFHVRPSGRGAIVHGSVEGAVRQKCVITLEPFDNPISESVVLRFAPHGSSTPETDVEVDPGAEDPPDPLVNGRIDLAAVIAEFLTLTIDPYPRKPGAVFSPPEDTAAKEPSPFAVLEKLKGHTDNGKT